MKQPKNTNVTIDEDILAWIDKNVETKRFGSRSHAVNLALSELEARSKKKIFRAIITKSLGTTEIELDAEPAKGTVEIQSVTVTNFDSHSERISIGILIPNDGNPEWHPVGKPWIDVSPNSPQLFVGAFYLEKGDILYAKFEKINLKDNVRFSKLELNAHGRYLELNDL